MPYARTTLLVPSRAMPCFLSQPWFLLRPQLLTRREPLTAGRPLGRAPFDLQDQRSPPRQENSAADSMPVPCADGRHAWCLLTTLAGDPATIRR
jgi:hypothetical protein